MLLCLLIVIGAVVLDQLTKLWVLSALVPLGSYALWPNVLHFTYVENRGAAFGMLADHRWVFMVISTAAIVGLLLYVGIAKPKSRFEILSLAFIIGGGIGNMIDRVFRGFVVDFIDVTCINFYVFNVADCFVCVGCGMMVLYLLLAEVGERKAKNTPKETPDADGN